MERKSCPLLFLRRPFLIFSVFTAFFHRRDTCSSFNMNNEPVLFGHPPPQRRRVIDEHRIVVRGRKDKEDDPPSLLDSYGSGEDGMGEYEHYSMKDDANDFDEQLLEYSIDSFLRGEYDRQFADDAPAPHPGLTPQTTVESALRSLRQLDDPEPSHGAAVFMRFCCPLSRNERWGGSRNKMGAWKELVRGAITPSMLARRLRASKFSCLLDWVSLDVTEGAYSVQRHDGIELGVPSSLAFVNAALYFGEGIEPILVQFTLRKINGVWLIDFARLSQMDLFVEDDKHEDMDAEAD